MDVHHTAMVNDQTVLGDLSLENSQFAHEGTRRAGDASAPQQMMEVEWNDETKYGCHHTCYRYELHKQRGLVVGTKHFPLYKSVCFVKFGIVFHVCPVLLYFFA